MRLIRGGSQVVCFPGATLDALEKLLAPAGREPHSVLGSSCIGASITGGIANNSGGALVRRGPAYTRLALFARVTEEGELALVNHLGIMLAGEPEEALARLDRGDYAESDIQEAGQASDSDYAAHVRDVEAATPSRFNADPRRLFEASGCAGKLVIFALRLDTFPAEKTSRLFYIGTNDTRVLSAIRRQALTRFSVLPISGEYIHRDAFDIAEEYGKDTVLIIHWLGTRWLAPLFAFKSRFDAALEQTGFFKPRPADRLLQFLSRLFPAHLPPRLKDFRRRFAHHLLLDVAGPGLDEAREFFKGYFAGGAGGAWFECEEREAKLAKLQRFAVAGAGVRYRAVRGEEVGELLAFDVALRRNDEDWFETLPPEIDRALAAKLYCGHFLCHVFHQDYILRKGEDAAALKAKILALLAARGAKYPAEHNVGHFYKAEPVLETFYRGLDPCNALNAGIGQTSKKRNWTS
jgi:D-lactate dehydrogenase